MIRWFIVCVAVLCSVVYIAGNTQSGSASPPSVTSIHELVNTPGQWDDEYVSLTGYVDDRIGVLGFSGFTLVDDLGTELLVVGAITPLDMGKTMTVTGTFKTAFTLGSLTVPVVYAEND